MTDAELLAAIYAAPDDDAPRAVYADWLQQRGDPRGELIALQLLRAQGGGTPEQADREHELLAAHGAGWLAPLPISEVGVRFERGFVSGCDTTGFLDENPAWATVSDVNSVPGRDACHTHSLRVLRAGDGGIAQLARLARPLAVETLAWNGPTYWDVAEPADGDPIAEVFGRIRVLPRLRRLELLGEVARPTGVIAPLLRPSQLAWAWSSRYTPVLAELVLAVDARSLALWAAAFETSRLWRVELRTEGAHWLPRAWRAILTRDAAGALSQLALVAPPSRARGPASIEALCEGLAALLPALTAIRLVIPARAWEQTADVRARIAKLVGKHGRATLAVETAPA